MHGSIFVFLKRFVESGHNYSTWIKLLENTGVARLNTPYQMHEVYPIGELFTLMEAAANLEGISYHTYQEQFGEFLVPDLLLVFKRFVNPSWKTYDMLQHIGSHMHGGIRKEDERTSPPPLHVSKVSTNLIIIDYHSKRKMAGFAVGIIKGIARYFNESHLVNVIPVTEPDAERVQIRVQFS